MDRVKAMVAATEDPTLTDDEVEALLPLARRADIYGFPPSDNSWTPTYDLSAAAAEGWRRKAGKVAGLYRFSVDNQSFDRQQIHDMCLAMAAQYKRGAACSVSVAPVNPWYPDVIGNVNVG
jgi:hypothetical protein